MDAKRFLLTCFSLLLFTLQGQAQVASFAEHRLSIHTLPLSYIDVYNGFGYKLGFEAKLFKGAAFYATGGGYFPKSNGLDHVQGHNIDLGLKYYFIDRDINQGTYLTLNYFYKEQVFFDEDSIMVDPPYEARYHVHKYVTCLNLNVGYLEVFGDRLVLDVFGGFGVRFRNANNTLTHDQLENTKYYWDSQGMYFTHRPGKFVWLNFNVRFRVGLRIF